MSSRLLAASRPLSVGAFFLVFVLAACTKDEKAPPHSPTGFAFALLADNRLLMIALESGEIVHEEKLAEAPRSAGPGHFLALSKEGETLFALLQGVPRRLAVVDTRTGRVRTRYSLKQGTDFHGVSLGPRTGRLYLFGTRSGRAVAELKELGSREQSALVVVLDPESGRLVGESILRKADRLDWDVYRGVLSRDERRLFVSYHGTSTTGADWFRISSRGVERCRRKARFRGGGCAGRPHGNVEPYRGGFLAATGSSAIVEVNPSGSIIRALNTGLENHVMEFATDRERLYAVGACYQTGGLSRVDLRSGRSHVFAPPAICGSRIALGPTSLLVLARTSRAAALPDRPGTLLFLDGRTGRIIRDVETSAEPVDVLVTKR